jgi:hypothetical protein
LVSRFVRVSEEPGTLAPAGSVTIPVILPVVVWADMMAAAMRIASKQNSALLMAHPLGPGEYVGFETSQLLD